MFNKRVKSRPSLRARDSDTESTGSPLAKSVINAAPADDEPEDGDVSFGSVLERKKAQKKDKRLSGVKSGGSRLSFGGDGDEGEGFKPKKSLLSQNIKLPPQSSPSFDNPPSSISSYSREYLSELKASTPTRAQRAAVEDADDGLDEEDGTGLSKMARDKYASSFVEDTTAGIPDAAAVASARMKRQAKVEAAKHGGNGEMEEDYIALGGGRLIVHDGRGDGPHPESRLMREEDEGEEGDEDLAGFTGINEKLHIGKKATKAANRRERGEIGDLIDEFEADEDSDEETREWELAQSRRAGGYDDDSNGKPVKKAYVPTPIPTSRPLPTISPVQARLAQAIAELRITKSENEHTVEVASAELAGLEEQERDLRKAVEEEEGKREWVEEFRGWVEQLGSFLEEVFPKLEAIETDALLHLRERADMVEKRRHADDSDDLALFLGIPPAPADEVEEVDEMGRSRRDFEAGPSSGVRIGRRADREQRRVRRRSRKPVQDDEGYSTDSTLAEGDAEDYGQAQHQLRKRVDGLLEDVTAVDFRNPEKGLAVRFGGWRKKYEDEYSGAFGGLSMVQAWAFWARGEMVGWEPMRAATSIEEFNWFNALHTYSHPRPHNAPVDEDEDMDDEPPLGPDGDLNAQMVNDAVVPLLTKAFENGAYDPYSGAQTRRAIDLLEVVEGLAGKDSRKFTGLLKSAILSINSHILQLSSTITASQSPQSTPPPAFNPASRIALQRYLRRRIKLLRNILLWRSIAPEETRALVARLGRELFRPVLTKGWAGGGAEMAEKVLQASGGLIPPDIAGFLQRGP